MIRFAVTWATYTMSVAVERGDRRRLLHVVDEVAQMRRRDLGQRQRRQVRPPELEHARAQAEEPAVDAHVAELDERQDEAAGRRAREAGRLRDVAQGERRVLRVERADHCEPALQRLHEVGLAIGRVGRRFG